MSNIFRRLWKAFRGDRRGNVAIMAALSMPVLMGSVGVGAEVASWYSNKRALQNAADTAAIAAATSSDERYVTEARAVAREYGLKHGLQNVEVEAMNEVACPDGQGNVCFRVTISRMQPLLLAQAVGFKGDGALDGRPAKKISATAMAIRALAPREYCLLALATSGDPEALRTNGAPAADMTGCSVASNSNMRCNGHNLNADFGDAHGTNSGCGKTKNSGIPKIDDPYRGRASLIPPNPCSEYSWIPEKKNDAPLPTNNILQGLRHDSLMQICGDAQLHGPLLIGGGPNVLIVIYGGKLDLDKYDIQTMPGSRVTFVFTGPHVTGHDHIPTGKKDTSFDIEAPTTGPWKGVAIYQDPKLTQGVNITEAGNQPAWDISGLVYLPHSSVVLSGAVNKSSNGKSCFVLVVDNLTINGKGSILDRGECPLAGLTMPSGLTPARGQLVS